MKFSSLAVMQIINEAPACFLSSCLIIDTSHGAFWGIGVYWSVSLGWWIPSINHYSEGQCTAICSVQPIVLYCSENWPCFLFAESSSSFIVVLCIIFSPKCILVLWGCEQTNMILSWKKKKALLLAEVEGKDYHITQYSLLWARLM